MEVLRPFPGRALTRRFGETPQIVAHDSCKLPAQPSIACNVVPSATPFSREAAPHDDAARGDTAADPGCCSTLGCNADLLGALSVQQDLRGQDPLLDDSRGP